MAISTLRICDSLNYDPNVKCNESTIGVPFHEGHAAIDRKLMTELDGKLMTEPSDTMESTVQVEIPHKRGHPKAIKTLCKSLAKGGVHGCKINSRTVNTKKRVTALRRKKKGSDAWSDKTIMLSELECHVYEDKERNGDSFMIQEQHQRMLL